MSQVRADTWPAAAVLCGLATAIASVLIGCEAPDSGTSVVIDLPGDGSAPQLSRAPFPSDVWRGPDGRVEPPPGLDRLFWRNAELVATHYAELDGFGVRPLIEFPVDGDIDESSVAANARVFSADGQPLDFEWRFDPDRLVIQGSPALGVVLESGATYTAVIERGIVDPRGRPVNPAPALEALRGSNVPDRWRTTAAALEHPDRHDWAGVAVFTTQDAQRVMRRARADLEHQMPEPTLSFADSTVVFVGTESLDQLLGRATRFEDGPMAGQERWGMSNPTGIAHDHVGAIATGIMTASRFRRVDTGTDGPEDETFEVDPVTGAPAVVSVDSIPVTVIVPSAPAPASGYPVVIFGHGLGASRHAALSFAEPMTAAGFVVVAIDADGHGSRWRGGDQRNNLASMLPEFSGDAQLIDGFGDDDGLLSTFDFLESLRNLSAARDGVRQSVLDLCQLIAVLRRPSLDLSALGSVRLDPDRIAYLGESFGALLGGILAAIEPDVNLFVLDVPAAGIVDLSIVNSPAMASLLEPIARITYELEGRLDQNHPAVSILQSLLDSADPMSFAPNVLRDRQPVGDRTPGPRHVVAIEVVGDEIMPNIASDSLAIALGLDVLAPHMHVPEGLGSVHSPAAGNVDGQTAVLVHYAPATHGANWTSEVGTINFVPGFPHSGENRFPRLKQPIEIENPIYPTLEQVSEILTSHLGGAAPIVTSTLAPGEL